MDIRGTSSLTRRKLNDAVLESFLVGNTVARPLVEASAMEDGTETLHLLWMAVGDVRNALRTLVECKGRQVEMHLNDQSAMVTARNVLVLRLAAAGETAAAVSVWCDAFLDASCREILMRELDGAWETEWLSAASAACRRAVSATLRRWAVEWPDVSTARERRDAALRDSEPGPEAADPRYARWRRDGRASTSAAVVGTKKTMFANPTLFAEDGRFAETSSPFGAFEAGVDMMDAWRPLFEALRHSIRSEQVSVRVSTEDLARPGALGANRRYDAIDASNSADYVGLVNVLLVAAPLLDTDGLLRTEHALSLASTLDHVLQLEFPYDPAGFRRVAKCIGLMAAQVTEAPPEDSDKNDDTPSSSTRTERVVRVAWRRRRTRLGLSNSEVRVLASQLLERSAPLPLNADMLAEGPKRAVELSYTWPKTSVATVVEVLARARKFRAARGCFDALFAEPRLRKVRLVRNSVLALFIELAARPSALSTLAPRLRFRRLPRVSWFAAVVAPREKTSPRALDPTNLRAGLFEPSLTVALVRNAKVLAVLLHNQGPRLWASDDQGVVFNAAFADVVCRSSADQIQLLDRLRFDPATSTLHLALPDDGDLGPAFPAHARLRDAFQFFVILDVLTYSVLSEPLPVAALHRLDPR